MFPFRRFLALLKRVCLEAEEYSPKEPVPRRPLRCNVPRVRGLDLAGSAGHEAVTAPSRPATRHRHFGVVPRSCLHDPPKVVVLEEGAGGPQWNTTFFPC